MPNYPQPKQQPFQFSLAAALCGMFVIAVLLTIGSNFTLKLPERAPGSDTRSDLPWRGMGKAESEEVRRARAEQKQRGFIAGTLVTMFFGGVVYACSRLLIVLNTPRIGVPPRIKETRGHSKR